jgi:O-antigen ligase/tetratricopeptide (TPR) repeat protein
LLSFITYASVFFLTVQMADRPSRVRSLVRTLFLSSIVVSGYGLLQYLGADPIQWGALPFEVRRSFSTYGNPDLLGGYLVFSLIVSLGLGLSEDNRVWRVVYWVGFLLNAVVWVTASVRGAWVGGVVGLAVVAAVTVLAGLWGGYRPDVVDYGAVGASMAAVVGLVVKSLSSQNAVMNVVARVKSILEFGEGSALTRFEIWQAAVNAIKARPILGFGADTFRLVFPKYKPVAYVKDAGYLSVADNVHDYPLQLASALGIIGFLLLYGVLGLVVWLAGASLSPIRADVFGALGAVGLGLVVLAFAGLLAGLWLLKDRPLAQEFVAWAFFGVFGYVLFLSAPVAFQPRRGKERLLLAAVWAASLAYIVHLFFGLSVTGSTVLLWFCFGILLAPMADVREVEAPAWGSVAAIGVLVACSAMFVYNIAYIVADNHYLKARIGGGQGRVAEVKAALALNPWNDMYKAELGLAYQDEMQQWLQQARSSSTGQLDANAMTNAKAAFDNAVSAMNDVIRFVPTEYDNYVFLTNLYNQAGVYFDPAYFEKAVQTGTLGIAAEPYGPAIRFQQAMAYGYLSQYDKGIQQLTIAANMDPAYTEAKMLLGDLYRRKGDLTRAKQWYEQAIPRATESQKQVIDSSLAAVEASMKAGEGTGSKVTTP